jgi:hypothetical protein
MKPMTVEYTAVSERQIQPDRWAKALVWSMWLILISVALIFLFEFTRNVPHNEDWFLVRPLTGNEPSLFQWLWAQNSNSEHRVPFARLIFLALLKATDGDFRAGMFFNIFSLGALSFAMIRVARHLRGGRTSVADAFFPLVLLHLGHSENLLWSWQMSQIIPTVLACLILLAIVSRQTLTAPVPAVVAGISLILLPLNGANGLIYVPLMAAWLGFYGVWHWRHAKTWPAPRWTNAFLSGSAVIALALMGLYFVEYKRPSWIPPQPSLGTALQATVKFLALGFGPIARSSWKLSVLAAIGVLAPSAMLAVRAVLCHQGQERWRAAGVMLFFGNTALFALAMGWGRAAAIPLIFGFWPLRYALFAVPALCTAYFIWELYGSARLRKAVQVGLFLVMFLLLPFNSMNGFWWIHWFLERDQAFEQDLASGTPLHSLAERHRQVLGAWINPGDLVDLMAMLHTARIAPFAALQGDPVKAEASSPSVIPAQGQPHAQSPEYAASAPLVAQEIRYHMPEADVVSLVWGINGWHIAPQEIWPAGTQIKDNVMYTPMIHDGDTFIAKIWVPAHTPIDYGFQITEQRGLFDIVYPVWDGDYREIPATNSYKEVKAALTLNHDLSDVLDHKIYFLAAAGALGITWIMLAFVLDLFETGLKTAFRALKPLSHNKLVRVSVIALVCISGGLSIYRLNAAVHSRIHDPMSSAEQRQQRSTAQHPFVTQEFRYRQAEASEVYLVWGVSGWKMAPEEQRPPGTTVEYGVMNTPMVQEGDTFVARMQIPAGTSLDYGFQTRKTRGGAAIVWVWDGDYHLIPTKDGVIELKAAVTLTER